MSDRRIQETISFIWDVANLIRDTFKRGEYADVILDMGPDIEEPCPLNLAPSATIAVMLAISDALALTLMELKNFTAADYHARHHRGYLGSKSRQPPLYDSEPDANS